MPLETAPGDRFVYAVNPRMAVLVTAFSPDGRPGGMAATWHTPLSFDPPLYGVAVAPERHTHSLIEGSGAFAVNFLPWGLLEALHTCGRVSGRDVDKIAVLGLSVEEGIRARVPLVSEAYAALECTLEESLELGDHTLFVGRVEAVRYRRGLLDRRLRPRLDSISPILYLGADEYCRPDPSSLTRPRVRV